MLTSPAPDPLLFIGLMSGTSLDGIDAVLCAFAPAYAGGPLSTLGASYLAFPPALRTELAALQTSGADEIQREALAANTLAQLYADCVDTLLRQTSTQRERIAAIGVHGQTIRHRPELGFTRQLNNPALLAELTGIDVIADFRSRDIAAGGQGAPLVPAFHQAVFSDANGTRVVANIGGMSNISILPGATQNVEPTSAAVRGFDTGPGNVLMDAWIATQRSLPYDDNGAWAASGKVLPALLECLRADPYFALPPPKSTGRDLFDLSWLNAKLTAFSDAAAADVQATLAAFTATTLADAIADYAADVHSVDVCGGGAYNLDLLRRLQQALDLRGVTAQVATTATLGIAPNQVEALAFAWLAYRFHRRQAGNLPAVTGAQGLRILGALYPA